MGLTDAVVALRQPAYTGEQRCWPCTGVNAVIAVSAAVVLGVAVPLGASGSVAVGGVALVCFAAVIYLRGYLVPGTPRLTKTYLPDWFLRYFDHHDPPPAADADVNPAAVLDEAGAVTDCEHGDDLCLTDAFRAAWHERIDELAAGDAARADLAATLDVPEAALQFEEHGEAFVALAEGDPRPDGGVGGRRRVGQWESRGAFIADMAGARALRGRYQGWDGLTPVERGRVLNGLRLFLDRCPTCDGDVTFGEDTVESCCRSIDVVAVTCDACGDRLFEVEQPAAA